MASKDNFVLRQVLRVLGTVAALSYLFFIVSESSGMFNGETPEIRESPFGIFMVFVLFAFFLLGFYYLWKKEPVAGWIWIMWYALLWIAAMRIWVEGHMTVILGLPIFILGILLVFAGRKRKGESKITS